MLLLGTRKGLWTLTPDAARGTWSLGGPEFLGHIVHHGVPERGWLTVKRQAMTVDAGDPVGVYFGTTGGEVWGSADEGSTWTNLAAHLPEIYSVEWAPS